MRTWNIGIVGGGPGGLMTAYSLQRAANDPFRITLFEAGERLGGKILTRSFNTLRATYEAGAAELYDYSHLDEDPLRDLIEELALPISRMEGVAAIVRNRIVANLDDLRDLFGPAAVDSLVAFDRRAKDHITPQEFYAEPSAISDPLIRLGFERELATIPDSNARLFVENFIHSDLATEPEKTSIAYGLHNYLMNDPRYMSLYGISGGNELLPRELARRLSGKTLFNHHVQTVSRRADGCLVVTAECDGRQIESAFDAVVLALPNVAIKKLSFPDAWLATAIAQHLADYDAPAHYLRVTIAFWEKFWHGRLTESYCMLDQFGGCCVYDESSRNPGCPHPVLGWLIAGSAAETLSERCDDELIELALAALPDFLASGRSLVREGHVHRWVEAVNAIPGGLNTRTLDRRHRPEPREHPHLFVVGDYLFDATLNGVLDSAEYVAQWIAALMADAHRVEFPGEDPNDRVAART
jgi:protoporphyrinogen oxidase